MASVSIQTPLGLVPALREIWSDEVERAGLAAVRSYDLAGAPLEVRAAGVDLLDQLTRALAHLPAADPGAGRLTARVWCGGSAAAAVEAALDGRSGGEPVGVASGERLVLVTDAGRVDAIDLDRGEALLWVDASARLQWYDGAMPFYALLRPWAAARELAFVHGAAVGDERGCVLLVGRSGAGKSTTALSCLDSPLRYLADDCCFLRPGDLTVLSVYSSAKTTRDALARLPQLADMFEDPGRPDGKLVAFLGEQFPERLLPQAPLRAFVAPRIAGGRESRLVPAGGATALGELAAGLVFDRPHHREPGFRRLAQVAAAVPSYVLELGSDLGRIPPLLSGLLDG